MLTEGLLDKLGEGLDETEDDADAILFINHLRL
jgi:hypothetical protein